LASAVAVVGDVADTAVLLDDPHAVSAAASMHAVIQKIRRTG
jgi:hypothetical protein